ncbi:MAG: rhodanese-related sulfurtransferase [Persicimonas sp.]
MQHQEPTTKNQQPTATNLAFYRFTPIERPDELREQLETLCIELGLKGTIIVAEEGVNAMLAGEAEAAEGFVQAAAGLDELADVPIKRSASSEVPFGRLDVKIKPEIVTMRAGPVDACGLTAEHLAPETFRDWLRSGEPMVVVDTRNDYEYRLGTFAGAINPDTDAFHEFPSFVEQHEGELRDQKVVMFCTGGIRCEKATSWMLERGIDEIYQLDGGVLNYFERIEDADRDWEGELFVFDRRVAVDTRLAETDTTLCTECGAPVKAATTPLCGCLA